MENVFPEKAPAGVPRAVLEAARGEHEPFQVAIVADGGALENVRAAARVDGLEVRLYRVGFVEVKTPSNDEGRAGRWPDPLIPDEDAFVGEKRRAFPFSIPAGEARAIWVDVRVPREAQPGLRRGRVEVTWNGGRGEIPVEIRVRNFVIPESSSAPVSFGLTGPALAKAHGKPASENAALLRRYSLALLRHRISVHGGSMEPAPWNQRGEPDFSSYDQEVAPFLDGGADPEAPGARWSAVDLRVPARLHGAALEVYLRKTVEHFRKRGWLSRAFIYVADEPGEPQLPEVAERARFFARVVPEVPRLVTREFTPLLDAINLWCPVVNRVDDKPDNAPPPPRDRYAKLWWYSSCMSHGCNIVGGKYFRGWPGGYVVDQHPMAQRLLPWLAVRYGVAGELYYNTVEAYAAGLDPWKGAGQHGGNLDGTLFYPGRPSEIGGRTDIPVESIRLQRIREGLEDREYLTAIAKLRGEQAARELASRIAWRTFDWERQPSRLYLVRRALADAVEEATDRGARIGRGAPPRPRGGASGGKSSPPDRGRP